MGLISLITGKPGPSGFGSASTAEQVTEGIDASHLTAIVTGQFFFFPFLSCPPPPCSYSLKSWTLKLLYFHGFDE